MLSPMYHNYLYLTKENFSYIIKMMQKKSLSARMKFYERMFTEQRLTPGLPALCRIDGKTFHSWTKGLRRPYDERLSQLMISTTVYLSKQTNALISYTQSDEITLCWMPTFESPMMFDGKVFKLQSILASMTARYFNKQATKYISEKENNDADFDCRVWNVPNEVEAVNVFIDREMDATRNSVSMAAQSQFSHNELHGKSCSDMHEMLHSRGINWNDYPNFFKRGTYVRKRELSRSFTAEELEVLPPKHTARTNPDLEIKRTVVMVEDFPPLKKVINREAVIFGSADPITDAAGLFPEET
jgi:tRNA(His) 5'-end guanylyltransferase